MHQFRWFSERGYNLLYLLQKEELPRKGGGSLRKGGSNPGGNYAKKIKRLKIRKMLSKSQTNF